MSQIRSKNTKPEMVVRRFLFSKGLRYRLHVKGLPGKPDIVLVRCKTVIFIHGCFWHGHPGCKYFTMPKTRSEWWESKIHQNQIRDNFVKKELESVGWRVYTIWECETKGNAEDKLGRIIEQITKKV